MFYSDVLNFLKKVTCLINMTKGYNLFCSSAQTNVRFGVCGSLIFVVLKIDQRSFTDSQQIYYNNIFLNIVL